MTEKQEGVFRSVDMVLTEMFIPQEIARDAVYTLGDTGLVQFRDLNRSVQKFQRTFVTELQRLDNVERQYRYFNSLLEKYKIPIYVENLDEEEEYETLVCENGGLTPLSRFSMPPSTSVIDDHVENANLLEERFVQLVEASEQLESQKTNMEEFRYLLIAVERFFMSDGSDFHNFGDIENEINEDELESGTLAPSVSYLTGVISHEKIITLEKILWRVLRGNLFFKHIELPDPLYDPKLKEKVQKDAFIVFTHGDLILERIKKIAESLDANLYQVEHSSEPRSQQLSEVNGRLNDLYKVLETTAVTLEASLYSISKELEGWNKQICKEKMVYQTLNLFAYDSNRKTLTAEGWIPKDELETLQIELKTLTSTLGSDAPAIVNVLHTNKTPPTFHRTNKFTKAFQDLCDCYAIPSFQEVNPGLATIVTFPFMFAIMFGDLGHGMLMVMVALVFVYKEAAIGKMKRDEILDMAYSGRYVLLLMGSFSIYTGLLYNDMFSVSLTVFKSGWKWPDSWEVGETIEATQVGVYSMGIDSAWHGAENALLFSNSLKMKLSIIIGFSHMLYSYGFALVNALYFNDMVEIFCNFIPGLLFMCSIFGYLVVCIIYKWSIDWVKNSKPAPGLLNMLINMFLAPGNIQEQLYVGQAQFQVFLLLVALVCIPWLLLAKPLYFYYNQKKHLHQPLPSSDYDLADVTVEEHLPEDYDLSTDDQNPEGSHGENLGDVIIHQVIHTIEWCLNCVSHTASYLRLWALSLAHAQLSTVLWSMTLQRGFGMNGPFGIFMIVFLFAMWFVLTCAILVIMEGTSAMLHSLRLHWVESMSKFFKGEGTLYEPFVFSYNGFE